MKIKTHTDVIFLLFNHLNCIQITYRVLTGSNNISSKHDCLTLWIKLWQYIHSLLTGPILSWWIMNRHSSVSLYLHSLITFSNSSLQHNNVSSNWSLWLWFGTLTPTLKSGVALDCSVALAFKQTEWILRKRPGVVPCWITPSTFSVSCCVFCTGIGSFGVRGDGDRANCGSKQEMRPQLETLTTLSTYHGNTTI